MKKIAVLLAEGFEEGGALLTVDVLRRAGFHCDAVGVTGAQVTSSHGITVVADRPLQDQMDDYDMVVLPGGLPGATNLGDDARVIELVRRFDGAGKFVAAICAAPMVLKRAGVSTGRRLTSYPSHEALFEDADYRQDLVVLDGNLITSRGPATTLAFAYALVEALGGDAAPLKKGMLYDRLLQSAASEG